VLPFGSPLRCEVAGDAQWMGALARSSSGSAPSVNHRLCPALGIASRSQEYWVLFDFRGAQVFRDPEGDITARIRPQVPFGDCRVDMLVSMQSIEGPDEDIRVHSKTAIVECDGFEFHRVTKQQVSWDHVRDRYPQSLGLPVLRFAKISP
jgi:hypothetical protein